MSKDTRVTITVKGRIESFEALGAFCEAVDADFGREPGWALERMADTAREGGDTLVLECEDVTYGYVERVKQAAVAGGIDIIVTCGQADEYLGSIYFVRGGKLSMELAYDDEGNRVMLDRDTIKALMRKGCDTMDQALAVIGTFDPERFTPLLFTGDTHDRLVWPTGKPTF